MRRIISILLFGLLLFNAVGYSIVFLSERQNEIGASAMKMIEQSGDDLVIKVPVSVPYQNNWDAPEPAAGQIRHDGQFYQMKSQQLINDTLYVHCEYDQGAHERFSTLVSRVNEQVTASSSADQQSGHSQLLKNFLKEYMRQDRKCLFFLLEWSPTKSVHFAAAATRITETAFSIPTPPPIVGC